MMRSTYVLSLLLGYSLPSLAVAADLDDFKEARLLWRSAALETYEYGYNKFCECHGDSPPETRVTVRDGVVSDVRHIPQNSTRQVPADPANFGLYWTIDEIFAVVESAFARGATVTVDYDPELGFPAQFFIDYDADLIGDEVDIRITRFSARGAEPQ
jgi:hypothetical protein